MKWLLIAFMLSSCGSATSPLLRSYDESRAATDYVWQNPFCLTLCNTNISAAASSAIGQGNSQSPTLTSTQSGGSK